MENVTKGDNAALYTLIGSLGAAVAGIFRKVPETYINQPDVGKYDLIKYVLWFVLGLVFIGVIYLIFRQRKR